VIRHDNEIAEVIALAVKVLQGVGDRLRYVRPLEDASALLGIGEAGQCCTEAACRHTGVCRLQCRAAAASRPVGDTIARR
jgi:hypothetical protein